MTWLILQEEHAQRAENEYEREGAQSEADTNEASVRTYKMGHKHC
jgi:hypothetical protein